MYTDSSDFDIRVWCASFLPEKSVGFSEILLQSIVPCKQVIDACVCVKCKVHIGYHDNTDRVDMTIGIGIQFFGPKIL